MTDNIITHEGEFVIKSHPHRTHFASAISFDHRTEYTEWRQVEVVITHNGPRIDQTGIEIARDLITRHCSDTVEKLKLNLDAIYMRVPSAQLDGVMVVSVARHFDEVSAIPDECLDFDYNSRREIGLEINNRPDSTRLVEVSYQGYENTPYVKITVLHEKIGEVSRTAGNISSLAAWINENNRIAVAHFDINLDTLTWYGDQQVGCFRLVAQVN